MKIKVFNFFHNLYEEGKIPFKTIQLDTVETPSKYDCVVFENIINDGKKQGLIIYSENLIVTDVVRKYKNLMGRCSERIHVAINCSQISSDSLKSGYSLSSPNVSLVEWRESNKSRMTRRLYNVLTDNKLIEDSACEFIKDINKVKFKNIRGAGNISWIEFETLRRL